MSTEEVWKEIPDHPKYEASTLGRIRNKKNNYILKNMNTSDGYYNIHLYKEKNRNTEKVHRIIAKTFIPNPENKPTVNHKNHNRQDNKLENLEWATRKEQNQHQRKPLYEKKKLLSARACQRIDKDTDEVLEEYFTLEDGGLWAKNNGLTKSTRPYTNIIACCSGRTKTCFGYKWRYKNSPNMLDEEWKPIPTNIINGVENYYISTYGRIKNPKGRINVGFSNTQDNYKCVCIERKGYKIHRLVALVFIPTDHPETKKFVNHKDGDKANPHVSNLEWVTQSENVRHALETGLQSCKKVIQYDLNNKKIQEFISINDAARDLSKEFNKPEKNCQKAISRCCRGKVKTVYGKYKFKFADT